MLILVKIDLEADLKREVANYLTGWKAKLTGKETLRELLDLFHDIEARNLRTARRIPHRSKELKARSLTPTQAAALSEIESRSIAGEPLKAFLSTRSDKVKFNDRLLNNWQIYHFHLNCVPTSAQGAKFVKRTKELLFAYITATDMYLLEVLDHTSFSEVRLIDILKENWPAVIEPYRLKGATAMPIGSADVGALWKANISTFAVSSDGTPYGLGGSATNGTGIWIVQASNAMLRALKALEEDIRGRAEELHSRLRGRPGLKSNVLVIELILVADGFRVRERNTGVFLSEGQGALGSGDLTVM